MSDSLERRKLARAAAHLAAQDCLAAGAPLAVPPLALMTDDERLPDPLPSVRALPHGSLVVLRAREDAKRTSLALAVMAIARARDLVVVIAGDGALAAACGADGLHLPEPRLSEAANWRARHPHFLITAAVHSFGALRHLQNVDAVFLSPIFPTASHPGRAALTAVRAAFIARAANVPVYALGGIDARNARLLSGFSGIAAIGSLSV